jgi:galactose mutarotase-like enzyme
MIETAPARVAYAPDVVELGSPTGHVEAHFVPAAGMIGWSLRERGAELLAHPVPLCRYVESGDPTALPLLHPWANRLAAPEYEIAGRRGRLDLNAPNVHTDPLGLPIHGLVAGCPYWEVIVWEPSRLRARLDYGAHAELIRGFPFPHVLELTADLSGDRLEVAARMTPTGDAAVPVAFGFHPYLRLPDRPRQEWIVELPVTSRMELDHRMLPTGRSAAVHIPPAPLGDRTFDDAFDGFADPPEFAISAAGRRVCLRLLEGYRFAQVYAPHNSDFICFEPMTAPVNPFASDRTLLAAPGSEYLARFEISAAQTA